MTRTRTIAALAVASALLLAACGSSSSDSSSDGGGSGSGSSSKAPVALSGKVNDKGTEDVSGDGATAKVEMELDDNYYSPTFIKAAPGATVTVELENEGSSPHTFTLDDGDVDTEVAPGKKAEVNVTIPETGTLRFSCNFHGSMGMQGAFYTGAGGSSGAGSSDGSTTTDAPSTGGY